MTLAIDGDNGLAHAASAAAALTDGDHDTSRTSPIYAEELDSNDRGSFHQKPKDKDSNLINQEQSKSENIAKDAKSKKDNKIGFQQGSCTSCGLILNGTFCSVCETHQTREGASSRGTVLRDASFPVAGKTKRKVRNKTQDCSRSRRPKG